MTTQKGTEYDHAEGPILMTECHQDRAGDASRPHGGDERLRPGTGREAPGVLPPFTSSPIAPIMDPGKSAAGNLSAPSRYNRCRQRQ
jgi:hypothetical protein